MNFGINWTAAAVILAAIGGFLKIVQVIVSRIFSLGKISERLANVETSVNSIKTDMTKTAKELKTDINSILIMLAEKGLARSNSPRTLSDDGIKVLNNSGINAIVDDKYNFIVKQVKKIKPENPYQAELAVLDVVSHLVDDPVLKDAVEEGAFKSGYFVPSVLFVGGLYIRNRVLKELGFSVGDIDKHDPKKGK